jgi:hypothetical protein
MLTRMTKNRGLVELVRAASVPVSRTPTRLRDTPVRLAKERLIELEALLHLRDGFRALEGAVLVRPSITVGMVRGIPEWNQLSLWRTPFTSASEILFFAEDVIGRQFGLYRDEIVLFEPETGKFEHFAFRLEAWAEKLVSDPDAYGRERVNDWQLMHPELTHTDRLLPYRPRTYSDGDPERWRVVPDLELMKQYARLHREKAKVEDASTIDLSWWWGIEEPVDDLEFEPEPEPEPEPKPNVE